MAGRLRVEIRVEGLEPRRVHQLLRLYRRHDAFQHAEQREFVQGGVLDLGLWKRPLHRLRRYRSRLVPQEGQRDVQQHRISNRAGRPALVAEILESGGRGPVVMRDGWEQANGSSSRASFGKRVARLAMGIGRDWRTRDLGLVDLALGVHVQRASAQEPKFSGVVRWLSTPGL